MSSMVISSETNSTPNSLPTLQQDPSKEPLFDLMHYIQKINMAFLPAKDLARLLFGPEMPGRNRIKDLKTCLYLAEQTHDIETAKNVRNFISNLEQASERHSVPLIQRSDTSIPPLNVTLDHTRILLKYLSLEKVKRLRLVSRFWKEAYTVIDLFEKHLVEKTVGHLIRSKIFVWKKMMKQSDPTFNSSTTTSHLLNNLITRFFQISTSDEQEGISLLKLGVLSGGMTKSMNHWVNLYPNESKEFKISQKLHTLFLIKLLDKFKQERKLVKIDTLSLHVPFLRLNEINVSNVHLYRNSFGKFLPVKTVKTLTIEWSIKDIKELWPKVIEEFPNIEELKLITSYYVDEDLDVSDLASLIDAVPNLTKLSWTRKTEMPLGISPGITKPKPVSNVPLDKKEIYISLNLNEFIKESTFIGDKLITTLTKQPKKIVIDPKLEPEPKRRKIQPEQ